MLHRLRNYFITGMAIILPLAVTIIIVRYLFMTLNSYILTPLVDTLRLNPYLTEHSLIIAKAMMFIAVILFISAIGWAANIIFLRRLFGFGEKIFVKVPMIGKIYSVSKEIGSAFLGRGKAFLKKPVLVEYPRKGVYSLGFTTGEGKGEIKRVTEKDIVTIFLPTTPNPTSGIFLIVPKDEVKFLDMTVEEGLKLVVSSGAISPKFNNFLDGNTKK